MRHRYGWHSWGMRSLMARRLVEAGVSFVTVIMAHPSRPDQSTPPSEVGSNWDAHAVNWDIFKDARHRLPMFDQAVTALVEDLNVRGLDKKVMVIVTGEFGRTPRLTYTNGRAGRDHWPQAMSVLVSGGGLRMGQVVGSTTSRGEQPQDRPLVPNDLWATMFRHLGIDCAHVSGPHGAPDGDTVFRGADSGVDLTTRFRGGAPAPLVQSRHGAAFHTAHAINQRGNRGGILRVLARWPLLFALLAIPLSTERQLKALLTIAGGETVVLP